MALLDLIREGLEARKGRKQRLMSGQPLPGDVAPSKLLESRKEPIY